MDKELRAEDIVYGLSDPIRCNSIQLELISLGSVAVKPLISFLLSWPSNDHQPRCLAAETLGIIGGDDALNGLVTTLLAPINVPDPVKALAEEAVKDCICHALQSIRDKRAVEPLLIALERYHLVGAAEALAEFKEKRAIPILVRLLEDSFKRIRVSGAIVKFGADAVEELIRTTELKRLREDVEILPSIERRAEAVKLLGIISKKNVIPWLLSLLDDEQALVRLEASLSLLNLMGKDVPSKAIEIIKSSINNLNLEKRLRIEEALCLMNTRGEDSQ